MLTVVLRAAPSVPVDQRFCIWEEMSARPTGFCGGVRDLQLQALQQAPEGILSLTFIDKYVSTFRMVLERRVPNQSSRKIMGHLCDFDAFGVGQELVTGAVDKIQEL
ncbi:hypothetical protein GCM10023212_11440 [Luteolibacter yonseiensis]